MPCLALFHPDIPQNVGAAMRLCACMGVDLHIIEPCGFPWNERKIKQAGMDYTELAQCTRHSSWERFYESRKDARIILMTTKGAVPYTEFEFQDSDILLAGRESEGVPENIHETADARVLIPMAPPARSLNIVTASAMILGEAIRQVS